VRQVLELVHVVDANDSEGARIRMEFEAVHLFEESHKVGELV